MITALQAREAGNLLDLLTDDDRYADCEWLTPAEWDDQGDDDLWGFHCYVWGMACGGEHDTRCDDPDGHWALAELALDAGWFGYSWGSNAYERWIAALMVLRARSWRVGRTLIVSSHPRPGRVRWSA